MVSLIGKSGGIEYLRLSEVKVNAFLISLTLSQLLLFGKALSISEKEK